MRLKQRLIERIRESGPITFAEFMDAALYDAEEGFYARPRIGADGDFVTSPHVSPAFAELLARQLGQVWDLLGRPSPFTVAEVGAGDGTLARRILESTRAVPELTEALRYVGIERTRGSRRVLEQGGVETADGLGAVGRIQCVIANELLDNLPFHRLREQDGRVVEVRVAANGDRLVEQEGEPTPSVVAALTRPLANGEERPVSLAARGFVRAVARSLDRGYAFLFDYGFTDEAPPAAVHAYREHRVLDDVLADPGSRDITAAVDLGAVADEARDAGLQVWGPISQRDALLGLGFRTWIQGVRSRQTERQIAGAWRDATRFYSERSSASILIDPDKLGSLKVLVFGTPGLPPPAAALGDRETGC